MQNLTPTYLARLNSKPRTRVTPATAATWFCGVVMGGALCLLAYHAAPTIIWAMSLQPHHGPHLTCNPDPAICLFTGAAK